MQAVLGTSMAPTGARRACPRNAVTPPRGTIEAELGPNHRDTLAFLNNLANAYRLSGQRGEAMAIYEQALAKHRENAGLDHANASC